MPFISDVITRKPLICGWTSWRSCAGSRRSPRFGNGAPSLPTPTHVTYELLSLPDLVQAKKTQRSKDWPMLQRLVEAHYLRHRAAPTPEQQQFWLRELRTPELLSRGRATLGRKSRALLAVRTTLARTRASRQARESWTKR